MSKLFKTNISIGLALFVFTIACRVSQSIADFYSLQIYPFISGGLSYISSLVPFALQDVAICCIVIGAIAVIVTSVKKRWRWKRCVSYELAILLWTYLWFYTCWCNNYARSSIFVRTSTKQEQYDKTKFNAFIHSFAQDINEAWTDDSLCDKDELEREVKMFYANAPKQYGLAEPKSWQHPKTMTVSRFYSAVGVQGYMAPLLSESFINKDVLPFDYPFVYAHEYSHLLGVSSEAEANWWAFHACISSCNPAIRYSGYKGVLNHVIINARNFLSKEEYEEWISTFRPEVLNDIEVTRNHWLALHSPILNDMQDMIYDLFLKGNKVSSGKKNYSEVVQLLISLEHPE